MGTIVNIPKIEQKRMGLSGREYEAKMTRTPDYTALSRVIDAIVNESVWKCECFMFKTGHIRAVSNVKNNVQWRNIIIFLCHIGIIEQVAWSSEFYWYRVTDYGTTILKI